MSIEMIRECNPDMLFYTTSNPEFLEFGKVLAYDTSEIVEQVLRQFPIECHKANYIPNIAELHGFEMVEQIKCDIYGELNIQVGIVSGQSDSLTGLEYHQCSEVNVAFHDCLLLLGKRADMEEQTYDAEKIMRFYIRKGEVLEIFSSSLHYTPIQVDESGVSLGVMLLEGTNTELDNPSDPFLTKKNKWYITHKTQTAKINAGCLPGLKGELITIKHKR